MEDFVFSKDYKKDYIRWISVDTSNLQLDNLQCQIIKDNDVAFAYFFAYEFNYKTYLMQKVILDANSPKYAFLFSLNIPNADIKALQNLIIKSNNLKYLTYFACFIKNCNYNKLEKIIINSNNIKCIYFLFKNNLNINLNKVKSILLNSKNPRYLFELVKRVETQEEVEQIEDLLIELKACKYIRLLAENVKLANIDKLEEAILESNDMKEIKKFAKSIKKSKMNQFLSMA